MNYLVLNLGSSSLKFKLFNQIKKPVFSGIVERIGQADSFVIFKKDNGEIKLALSIKNHQLALELVFEALQKYNFNLKQIKKVGHRVVHGGQEFVKPTLITRKNFFKLEKYNYLAPLHNPFNLKGIHFCLKNLPQAQNYAVFDTAFYFTLPDYSFTYALPRKYKFRKFGFHGISHEYVASQVAKKLKKPLKKLNLITCHLGSGCSITAVKNGQAVDTSMGYTPTQGLMMSTRCGDLDPSISLRLVEREKSVSKVEDILNFKSGWFGLTGFKDMRDVLFCAGYKVANYNEFGKSTTTEQKMYSRLALEMFVYQARKYIGAYFLILGKVDAIVFTGGIGERSGVIRKMTMKNIKTKHFVVKTDEESAIFEKI